MFYLFLVVYGLQIVHFIAAYVIKPGTDRVFMPWPGFAIIFSSYFLFGTLALQRPVGELQWLLYCLASLGFWIGSLFARAPVLGGRPEFARVDRSSVAAAYYDSFNGYVLAGCALISLTATMYLWSQFGIPLLSENVNAARTAVTDNGYIATLGTALDVAAIFSVAFIMSCGRRRKDWRFWLSVAVVLCFLAVAVLGGSRSRLLKLVVPAAVIYHFLVKPISLKSLIFAASIGVIFIGALGYYRAYSLWGLHVTRGFESDFVLFRVIYAFATEELRTAAYGLDIVVRTMPDTVNHTWGLLHAGPLLMPLPIETPVPGMFFKDMIGGRWDGFGLAATFIAPMYADFSWPGVLVLSAAYSFLLTRSFYAIGGGGLSSGYKACLYGILFYIMLSGMRSDMVSFELIWFVAVAGVFEACRRRANGAREIRSALARPV